SGCKSRGFRQVVFDLRSVICRNSEVWLFALFVGLLHLVEPNQVLAQGSFCVLTQLSLQAPFYLIFGRAKMNSFLSTEYLRPDPISKSNLQHYQEHTGRALPQ